MLISGCVEVGFVAHVASDPFSFLMKSYEEKGCCL